jgi:hypothetical protein
VADPLLTLEVLLEGGGGSVSGAGLAAQEPVSMEGRSFQRFTAGPVVAGASFTIGGSGGFGGRASRLALLAVAAIAVALGIVIGRRAPGRARPPVTERPATDALAREIAALDHVYAEPGKRAGVAGEHYRVRRTELIGQLVEAQAVEDRDAPT